MFEILTPYTEYILIGLVVFSILMLAWAVFSEMRLRRFMRGKNGSSLEGIISEIQKYHEHMKKHEERVAKDLRTLDERLSGATRGVATVRYDAFAGSGNAGKQSFATALLSENGNGVVVSSIHARESTRVYAKPIENFTSEHGLTEEEKSAITEAREMLASNPKH